jgi:nitrite reductase/ring-hydroxylating ferredoxin subunit
MRNLMVLVIVALSLFSCGKAVDVVPNVAVNFKIAKFDPSMEALTSLGGSVNVPGGIAGIVIYRRMDGSYTAYDRCSTYQPEKRCAVTVDDTGFTVTDPCSGSKFSLDDGGPVKAPATRSLKAYAVNVSYYEIFVSNN